MNKTGAVFLAFTLVVLLTQLFPVFAKDIPPVYEPIDPYLATPAPGHLYEIPVFVMRFLPTADGENLDVSKAADYWDLGEISLEEVKTRIDVFDQRIKFMLEEGSRFRGYKDSSAPPSLGYRVVEYITIYEQTPPGPVIGHEKGYPIYAADFHQIFDRFNIEHYVNDLGVKEIWVWMGSVMPGFPSYDPDLHKPENFRGWWESDMSSPLTGDISNSKGDDTDLPVYNSTYTVYGQNIRRSQAEAVHNHGHQLEAILSHVNHLQYGNTDLFWKKFVGQDEGGNFITGRAGWTHMPPNTTKHYDYTGTRTLVKSDIEDWTPDSSGTKKLVNVDTYGNLTYPWPDPNPAEIPQRVESQWYIYWMQSMPGYKNQIRYGNRSMTNWWVFTADWDAAISSEMGLVAQTVTELPQLRDPDSNGTNKSVDTVLGTVPIFDDPFEGNALQNPNWQWQNEPTHWDVGKTRKKFLHVESETNHNLWIADASHLLYQETSAEVFDVETHFFTRWDTPSGVNGLVVKSPADNDWVTLKFWAQAPGPRGQIQYQARGRGLAGDPAWQPDIGKMELFFRLRKDRKVYTGWYKTRKTDPWIKIGSANVALTPPLYLGIYAGVAANTGTLTVDYEYFRSTVNTSVQAAPTPNISIIVIPTETALLPNYPNPFNPETWIPYQLSTDADVRILIYDARGSTVRRLVLGHQSVGTYTGRSRAAYWDGRNVFGERVASGIYFYQLRADNVSFLRKMLILK